MKKIYGIAFLLTFCFALTLLDTGSSTSQRTNSHFSLVHQTNSLSSFSFGQSNSEIEIFSIHGISASQGNHGFQKILGYLAPAERNLTKYAAFVTSDNSLPGYLQVKEYLSHIYPFHNFW